ncbi:MAG: ferritin family protein [Desulfobacteraceae bacterium]|nr:ferritin family protein [Desulfobacteraceae bacterium]
MFSSGDICGIAVQIEENGERFYREAACHVNEASCKDLLLFIAEEEARHRTFFLDMKATLPARGEEWAERMSGRILEDAVADHAFSLDDTPAESLADGRVIIRTALGMEEDSILFYELLLSFVSDEETSRHIREIIAEERRHVEVLQKLQATPRDSEAGA